MQFGMIDGLYQGASGIVRLIGGFWSDRLHRHKEIASLGYALSAMCKLGFVWAGQVWTALAGVILLDRLGKGVRTAPRDALIAASAPKDRLAFSFGAHRAMDTAGAMIGPLVAFGLLSLSPSAYNLIFVVSFCLGVVGASIIILFVKNTPNAGSQKLTEHWTRETVRTLFRLQPFSALIILSSALSLFTMSDAFLFIHLHRRVGFSPSMFPLLYVVTAASAMLLAIPFGKLADRVGKLRVFLLGHLLLVIVYSSLLTNALATWMGFACLLLIGAFYAATEGVLAASASAVLSETNRASGLAILSTCVAISRMSSSMVLGWIWSSTDMKIGITIFLFAIIAVVIFAYSNLSRWLNVSHL
jgi:MFS family permease